MNILELSEIKRKKRLSNVITHITRRTLSAAEIDLIVDHMDLNTIVKVVILPSPEWAESKLSVKHSHKERPHNKHDKVYAIKQSFLPGVIVMGDREAGVSPAFDKEKPFAVLMECQHTGVSNAGSEFSCVEYELVIYCPHVDDADAGEVAAAA